MREHREEEGSGGRSTAEQHLDEQAMVLMARRTHSDRIAAPQAVASEASETGSTADAMTQERSRTRGRRRLQDQGALLVSASGRSSASAAMSSTPTNSRSSARTSASGQAATHERSDAEPHQDAARRTSAEASNDADEQASLRSLRQRVQRIQHRIAELEPSQTEERPNSAVVRAQGLQRQIQDLRRQVEELQQAESVVRRGGATTRVGLGESLEAHQRHNEGAGRNVGSFFAQLQGGRAVGRRHADTTASTPPQEDALHTEDGPMEVHPFVGCDGCGASPPLYGRVMTCEDCADYDLCSGCYRDRHRLGHPRSHRFRPRRAHVAAQLNHFRAHGELAAALIGMLGDQQMLEDAMLIEALRRSAEGPESGSSSGGAAAPSQEDLELRAAEVLSKLSRVPYAPGKKGEQCYTECALCLEEYSSGEVVMKLPCKHIFHEGCIGPWLVKSLTCPLCNAEVS